MAKTTTARLLSKPVSYIVETTEGTIPGTGSTTAIAVMSIGILKDGQFEDISQLGPEDILATIKGLEKFETSWKIVPLDNSWIQRLMNAANYGTPTGTVSETVSIVIPIYLNNVVNYIKLLGSRIVEGSYKRTLGKTDEFSFTMTHMDIIIPTATPPAGLVLATTYPSGTPHKHNSGGANCVSIGGSGVESRDFSITVNRNSKPSYALGSTKPHSTQPYGRRIGIETTVIWTAITHETAFDAETDQAVAMVVNSSGPVTITASNTKIKSLARDLDTDTDEEVVEKLSITPLSVNVTIV